MKEKSTHNYEYEVDLSGDSAPARVIRMVGDEKYVLEIGAGPGSITKHLQSANNCNVIALEIDDDAIHKLRPYCERVYKADLNDPSWPELLDEKKFDVVIAADVLEHVYDPWSTLNSMAGLIRNNGTIIISLPHVGHSAIAACLLDEDFDYRDWGLLDRTHIRFFGLKNMQALFNDNDLHIVDAQFVIVPPEESEFSDRWAKLAASAKNLLSSHKYGHVYQVVVKAVPANKSTTNIDLMKLSVKPGNAVKVGGMIRVIKRFIPNKYHSKFKSVARKLGVLG